MSYIFIKNLKTEDFVNITDRIILYKLRKQIKTIKNLEYCEDYVWIVGNFDEDYNIPVQGIHFREKISLEDLFDIMKILKVKYFLNEENDEIIKRPIQKKLK